MSCSLCNSTYVWPADLKRHLKNKHGQQKSTFEQQQRYTPRATAALYPRAAAPAAILTD
jgi:hypothetical protein